MNDPQGRRLKRRTVWLTLVFCLWAGVLLFRLVQLQVFRHQSYKTEVLEQSRNKRPIRPRRGTITDRQGTILARSLPAQSVFLTPASDESLIEQLRKVDRLKSILELRPEDTERIRRQFEAKERFVYLKRRIDPQTADTVKSLNLTGVGLHAESMRIYPHGRLASHVLGWADIDEIGRAGIEYAMNSVLEGRAGEALVLRDARRRKYRFETLKEALPGRDLTLTLDATIQYIAEKELRRAVGHFQAAWGSLVVADPKTGEILALANVPDFDPNRYSSAKEDMVRNRAVQDMFEPGSTFKIVTAAAALETGSVGLTETFLCSEDILDLPGKSIRDHKTFGTLNFSEIFIHSSNIGAAQIGVRTGPVVFHHLARAFGFGRPTGISLPGESPGKIRSPETWTRRTLPSLSIGYEVSVTALQMLQAVNIVANRGVLVPLRIVGRMSDVQDALLRNVSLFQASQRVLSPSAADRLTKILVRAVEEGTGSEAGIPGFPVAGKTGTAQKFDPVRKAYVGDRHLASFAGFVPADDPVLSLMIVID